MKKTLRRAIACLLAVLMVVFSVPFTASAAENNRKWWTDEDLPLKEEPEYQGYNYDDPEYGSWGLSFGDRIDLSDNDDGYEDRRDLYKPIIAITVSDLSNASATWQERAAALKGYYGYDSTKDYETVKSAGSLKDPSQLKTGDRIAVTVELGGFDLINNGQIRGNYDPSMLKAAYYSGTPSQRKQDPWTDLTGMDSTSVLANGTAFYSKAMTVPAATVDADHNSFYAALMGAAAGSGSASVSNFIGERPFGKYGIYVATFSFEVLQDCDLAKAFTFDNMTMVEAYARDTLDDNYYNFTVNESDNTSALFAPIIWSESTASTEPGPEDHKHTYTQVEVQPTCTDNGKFVYTCDNSDGLGEVGDSTYEEPSGKSALGHDYDGGEVVIGTDGVNHTVKCVRYEQCNSTTTVACTPVADDSVNKAATSCTPEGAGWEGATKCQICGQKLDAGHATDPLAHTSTPNTDKNKDATCTEAGWENATKCQVCGTELEAGNEIPALNHDYTGAVDHFDETGHYRQCVRYADCSSVNEVAEPHDMQQIVPEKPAGPGVAGTTAVMKCKDCDYQTGGDEIPAEPIPGATHNVTVVSTPLGSTTLQYVKDGEPQSVTINAADYNTQSVTVQADNDTQITLKATPNDDVEFVGWMVNSSILNSAGEDVDNPHTAKVLADITYEPIFKENESSEFTVVFTDKFGNVFNTQTVTSGEEIEIPDGPVYKGYTFTSWSMTDEEIKALTEAATIYAKYDRNVEETFTVTAMGATITTPYAETQNTNTGIGYNTQVTVKADGAKVWKIDGAVVGYGESYTFYVGADVELTFESDAVTETPVVAAISTEKIGAPGAYKASFLASRNVVGGYTYVNAGFVYGMNQEVSDLTLANVNQSTIRAYYCTTDSEQFVLNVGASSQSGKIVARAFLAYVDPAEDGTTKVVYADFDAFDYAEV